MGTQPAWRLKRGARILLPEVRRAASFCARAWGLLGHGELSDEGGLWITPCSSVHTCFMRHPIDIVFLDRRQKVLSVHARVRPWRLCWGSWQSGHALELAAGAARRLEIVPGETLELSGE